MKLFREFCRLQMCERFGVDVFLVSGIRVFATLGLLITLACKRIFARKVILVIYSVSEGVQ